MRSKILSGMLIGLMLCAGSALAAPEVLATDDAGNYTPATFTNQSNLGTGFGAWELWNEPATLGDSTAGGGGDLNSTNGYSFQFMADGALGWCNGKRNLSGDLETNDVLSFTFTYNYDGGNRGVDIFCSTGQFANVIDVSAGNSFKVNGTEISTEWSPGAVVAVDITQLSDGVQVHLTRTTNGTENLNYTTNILNPEAASGFSLYCGGYETNEFAPNNVDFAIFMNDIQVMGEPRNSLAINGTWDPDTTGDYEYTLTRTGSVGDDIVLMSDNTAAVTVPAAATFITGSNVLVFTGTVVSVTNGNATLTASNTATGTWTEFVVQPVAPSMEIAGEWQLYATGPTTYTLTRYGAVGDDILLSSSAPGVMTVPATTNFGAGESNLTFEGTAVGTGSTTLYASNAASGIWAEFNVTVSDPSLDLTGPATAWTGDTKTYTLTRHGPVDDTVNLSSTDTNVMTVPLTVDFPVGEDTVTFQGVAVGIGSTTLSADNDDVDPATLGVDVTAVPNTLASDHAGNYTLTTFTNGANEGTGFLAWNLWNEPATLGDSTAGGGGDINSTNGYAFRFMGDGANGWCNGQRDFDGALQESNVLSFTFTYNWDGGGRGVDIFCSTGQFANLIDVSSGNSFKVNGTEISTEYSPGAVVDVTIEQQTDGIQMSLVRSVGGTPNLNYTTNIMNTEPASGVSMYCGGYTADPIEDNVNYAIFMNDLTISGDERAELNFTDGTWNPGTTGDYTYTLERSGPVTDDIVLSSTDEMVLTVPAAMTFETGVDTMVITATVVSVTNGNATILASNTASGAWAEYIVYPSPAQPEIGDIVFDPVTGDFSFTLPTGYTLYSVEGADNALTAGDWVWVLLTESVDYTLTGNQVTILTDAAARKVIRIWVTDE